MKKIWLCCAALAVLGLMGFAGSSTFGGITPVGDEDAALLSGGDASSCFYEYVSQVCNGCGAASSCPYGYTYCPVVVNSYADPCGTYVYIYAAIYYCYDCGTNYPDCGSTTLIFKCYVQVASN
jgi:hypothetical protein